MNNTSLTPTQAALVEKLERFRRISESIERLVDSYVKGELNSKGVENMLGELVKEQGLLVDEIVVLSENREANEKLSAIRRKLEDDVQRFKNEPNSERAKKYAEEVMQDFDSWLDGLETIIRGIFDQGR